MSGGSYNHLYSKEPEDITQDPEMLQALSNRLRSLEAIAAAEAIDKMVDRIIFLMWRMKKMKEDLEPIMHDVEWYDSYDINLDDLKPTLQAWYIKHNIPFPEIKDRQRQ
jgi:hypothetical protein